MSDSTSSLHSHIIGTGSYLPEQVLTNADLEKLVDTSDEWIISRTGIKERRIASPEQHTSVLATNAARKALEDAGVPAGELDVIIVGTCTADSNFPSVACLVQKEIGAVNAFAFDVNAACSGFLYSLELADQFLKHGKHKTALVIGAEKISSLLDWTDRGTCVLFGDAAGAAVVQAREEKGGVLAVSLGSDGNLHHLLSSGPPSKRAVGDPAGREGISIQMSGPDVFKHAVTRMSQVARELLEQTGLDIEDVAWVIPHQANLRIVSAVRQKLGVPQERLFVNLDKYGNTSAATVIVAMDEAARDGKFAPGDKLLLVAFGAGFTWGATLLEWSKQ